jgi:chromosome segregation ATPase
MAENIIKSRSPIEEEIEKKHKELADLENELAEAELAHATFENELSYFEKQYYKRVGALLAELDELNAQIAEAIAVLSPDDNDIQEEATEARAQAEKTFEEAYTFSEDEKAEQKPEKFAPSEEIKKLFRDIAKKIHPDLAKDDADRERRNQYMKQVNEAYRDGNIERLIEIMKEWEDRSKNELESKLDAELERLNRLITKIRRLIQEIKDKIKALEESEIGHLKTRANLLEEKGEDLISQIALEIQAQINKKHKRILSVIKTLTQPD